MGCSSSSSTPVSTPLSSNDSISSIKTKSEEDLKVEASNDELLNESKQKTQKEQNEGQASGRGKQGGSADHPTDHLPPLTNQDNVKESTKDEKQGNKPSSNIHNVSDNEMQTDKRMKSADKKIDQFASEVQLSLKNILIKAEQKKRQLYAEAAGYSDGDKATIHLTRSFKDTAPVSPVQSKENTITEPEKVEDVQDFWDDEPIETAESEPIGEDSPW